MPAIYLFERRTFFGGDDLQPAIFVAQFLRLIQLTLLLGPIFAHVVHESSQRQGSESNILAFFLFDSNQQDDSCRHSHVFGLLLLCYALASACYTASSALLEWRIYQWAGQGPPTQTQPRSCKVSYLMELKLLPFTIFLFLVLCTGISMISFAPHYYRCQKSALNNTGEKDKAAAETLSNVWNSAQQLLKSDAATNLSQKQLDQYPHLWLVATAILLLTQLSEVVVSVMYLIHLCSQPRTSNRFDTNGSGGRGAFVDDDYADAHDHHELVEEMWARRCASACQCMGVASCFMFGGKEVMGSQGDFGDIARALTDYLETRGVLDVVPSDIAAGFMVLRRLQKSRLHRSRQQIFQERVQSMPDRACGTEDEENILDDEGYQRARSSSFASATFNTAPDESVFMMAREKLVSGACLRQSILRYTFDGNYERASRRILNPTNAADMMALDEGARYAKYALSIYTWVLYLYVHPVTGLARLAARGGLACWRRRRKQMFPRPRIEPATEDRRSLSPRLVAGLLDEHGRIEGDNICEAHKTALLLTAGLNDTDLVYLQLKSGFRDNPYCILLDHEWKSVVVSIRGTFSLEDCVTDVLIEPEPLDQLGRDFGFDAQNQYCHGGVLLWVRNIWRDLQRHQILERLLLGVDAQYPGYTLRLVGHSLGAAACTILSYMLRQKFPTLRCVNYSPPGCTLTWDLAIGCKDWCNSFVLDSDIVPRLSFDTMEKWRDEILELIARIKVPKAEVVRRFMALSNQGRSCEVCFDPPLEDPEASIDGIEDILYEPHQVPDTEYKRQLERFRFIQEERRRSRGERRAIKLFPPGNMVHLVKTGEKRACVHGIARCLTCFTTNYGFRYTPVWIDNDDLNEIVISPQMGTDHFPNRMHNVVTSVAKEYGRNT